MSNKPKRAKPTIIQLIPIIHRLFGRDNHYLSNYGCKQRAIEEFYKQLDGVTSDNHKYPQYDTVGHRTMPLPASTSTIITSNK